LKYSSRPQNPDFLSAHETKILAQIVNGKPPNMPKSLMLLKHQQVGDLDVYTNGVPQVLVLAI